MKKIVTFEISKHDEIIIDEREFTENNVEIAKSVAKSGYDTLHYMDKKKRLVEVRIMAVDENGDYDYSQYDVIYSVGVETRF